MSEITKITKTNNVEGFIQIDYFKGNKYIDKAGEFLDSLYEDKKTAPSFQMTPHGAEITFPNNRKIRVGGTKLWTGFPEPDSFDVQKQFALKAFDSVVKLFEPQKYERVGWRNYFVVDTDPTKLDFFKTENWFGGKLFNLKLEKEFGTYDSNINITKIVEGNSNVEKILFDIDIYKRLQGDTKSEDIKKILDEIRDQFNSNELLGVINTVIK